MNAPRHSNPFKLALAQMLVLPGRKMQNLQRAVECIADAARAGARIVLLPEALTLGWTHFSAKTEADEIPSDISCSILCDAANTNKIYVCAGLVEKASEKSFNSAVLIDPKGEIILRHRKIHELDIAQNLYSRGDHLEVIETPLGTFGVMICADAFAPGQSISRTLGLMGAQMILSPCSWAMPADHDNAREPYGKLWLDSYQPVARDFKMWIAGASNVGWIEDGPWKGRQCIGSSMVVSSTGEPILRGPYGVDAETLLYCDITLS